MNNVTRVKRLLSELIEDAPSPLYTACQQITLYLEQHPFEDELTIGGLRVALRRTPENDEVLIRAAFTLSFHPFYVLQVRYRLFDEKISKVVQKLEHAAYMDASTRDDFVDVEGNDITPSELQRRTFPYFVNLLRADAIPTSVHGGKTDV
jgi:hypothetical protein